MTTRRIITAAAVLCAAAAVALGAASVHTAAGAQVHRGTVLAGIQGSGHARTHAADPHYATAIEYGLIGSGGQRHD